MPKDSDLGHGNEAKSTDSRQIYKKRLCFDFMSFRKTEGSNGWFQTICPYDSHFNKRTKMCISANMKNPVYINKADSEVEYKNLENMTPFIQNVMVGIKTAVYRASGILHYFMSGVKRIFDNELLNHLQKLISVSNFNTDLLCSVKLESKSIKSIPIDVVPKDGDLDLGNGAKSHTNWQNYKKLSCADSLPFQKAQESIGWNQTTYQYDDHLNNRTEMCISARTKNPVYIKKVVSEVEYKQLENLTPIIQKVMVGNNTEVYRTSPIIHYYMSKVKRIFDNVMLKYRQKVAVFGEFSSVYKSMLAVSMWNSSFFLKPLQPVDSLYAVKPHVKRHLNFNQFQQRDESSDQYEFILGCKDSLYVETISHFGDEEQDPNPNKNLFSKLKSKIHLELRRIQEMAGLGVKKSMSLAKAVISRAVCDGEPSNISYASIGTCNPVKQLRTSMDMFNDKYSLSQIKLGDGRNGGVFLAKSKSNGREVAVKIVNLEDLIRDEISGISIPAEIYWLKKVKDINGCLKYIDYYYDEKNAIIVTEFQENWLSLDVFIYIMIHFKEQLQKHGIRDNWLTECLVLKIFQQIVSIVAKLEECGIAHRDLRANNMLIDVNFNVTLIDFDVARKMEDEITNPVLIYDHWFPPSEINSYHRTMKEKYNTLNYDFSESDKEIMEEMKRLYAIGPMTTWSLGVILAQLLLLEPDTFWESADSISEAVESRIYECSVSPLVRKLLFMCLNQDPNKRPSTKEILDYLNLNLPYIINNQIKENKKFSFKRIESNIEYMIED
ncbi:hypothetical protein QYM36_001239 [Artemia franciscana]|uniref:non-specific serine/threonine protein kinase n=1 Tax=Artemia franciscana TaxID=6661 RepID=A0AA88IMV5_ARTSF|nr:hypothetical protein QYM36_001239 [Artemia franciscana]